MKQAVRQAFHGCRGVRRRTRATPARYRTSAPTMSTVGTTSIEVSPRWWTSSGGITGRRAAWARGDRRHPGRRRHIWAGRPSRLTVRLAVHGPSSAPAGAQGDGPLGALPAAADEKVKVARAHSPGVRATTTSVPGAAVDWYTERAVPVRQATAGSVVENPVSWP